MLELVEPKEAREPQPKSGQRYSEMFCPKTQNTLQRAEKIACEIVKHCDRLCIPIEELVTNMDAAAWLMFDVKSRETDGTKIDAKHEPSIATRTSTRFILRLIGKVV